MKKLLMIVFTVILNVGIFSCNPESLTENPQIEQSCCGEMAEIPPPPPPPDGL
ncbi:hypothetical protein [Winogradskyella tangerina]|uniref:hypothetical protein n=1 Tax=Winogradskyella tangerina TaxID=2023240 RepID=UPI00130091AF|nr:hypothetical protein [Winogradskyella tangerina]